MELLIDPETVEPSAADFSFSDAPRRVRLARIAFRDHMECCAVGRTLLAGSRWAVVLALIVLGYFAAAGINAGVELVRQGSSAASGNSHPVLATAAASAAQQK